MITEGKVEYTDPLTGSESPLVPNTLYSHKPAALGGAQTKLTGFYEITITYIGIFTVPDVVRVQFDVTSFAEGSATLPWFGYATDGWGDPYEPESVSVSSSKGTHIKRLPLNSGSVTIRFFVYAVNRWDYLDYNAVGTGCTVTILPCED